MKSSLHGAQPRKESVSQIRFAPKSPSLSLIETLLLAWVAGVACSVAAGWVFSAAHLLRYVWVADLITWTAVVGFLVRTLPRKSPAEKKNLREILRFAPFLFLVFLICLSAFSYLPATHDSLSYRIPRIFLWLQDGTIGYVPTSDARINYMTHNWELVVLPIVETFGSSSLEVANILTWAILYILGTSWAEAAGAKGNMKSWLSILLAGSTFCVLQGSSTMNDLFAGLFVYISAWFAYSFRERASAQRLVLSALALALACGTKPHYIVLGLPWLLWFFAGQPRPWRFIPWKHVVWVAPLVLLISPLPAFLINHAATGSWKGASTDEGFVGGNPVANVFFGTILYFWQALQPPLNPLANIWNSSIASAPLIEPIRHLVPKFSLKANLCQIVDFASLGFVVVPLLFVGWFKSFFLKRIAALRWMAAAGALGFFLAVSQVVPATIGRSFSGFIFLLVPLAIAGLVKLKGKVVRLALVIVFLSGCISVAMNATRPLWPVQDVQDMLNYLGMLPKGADELMTNFKSFRSRANAGYDLCKLVPLGSRIAVVAGAGEPLVCLWESGKKPKVYLVPANADFEWLRKLDPDAILVTGTGPEMHAALIEEIAKNYQEVASRDYIVRLQRGPEKWFLFSKRPEVVKQKERP